MIFAGTTIAPGIAFGPAVNTNFQRKAQSLTPTRS